MILIDKEEFQVKGSEIRLKSCLNEVPCDEVGVLKGGVFANMIPLRIMDFLQVSSIFAAIVFFHAHCHN